jgi:hypothetical protein
VRWSKDLALAKILTLPVLAKAAYPFDLNSALKRGAIKKQTALCKLGMHYFFTYV